LLTPDFLRNASHERDIDKAIHRIRRRLDKDNGDMPISHGALRGNANALLVESVCKADTFNAEWRKGFADENFRTPIKGATMQYYFTWSHVSEDGSDNGRHAG